MAKARQEPSRNLYPLNYGWGHGDWTDEDDVLLEARFSGGDVTKVTAAIRRWYADKHEGEEVVDGVAIAMRYHGGGWFHLGAATAGAAPLVYLHSSGEDAFDTLEWYANELRRRVERVAPDVRIKWIEHKHVRDKLVSDRHRRRAEGQGQSSLTVDGIVNRQKSSSTAKS